MNVEQVLFSRRGCFAVAIIFSILLSRADGVARAVTHYCFDVATDTSQVRIQTQILINDDPLYKVYAFDATSSNTESSVGRTTDAACILDGASIADGAKSSTPLVYDFTITISDASHACGVSVVTDSDGVTIITFLFKIYASTDNFNTISDIPYEAICRTDDLTGNAVSTEQFEATSIGNVIRQQESLGSYLRLRSAGTNSPVIVARVGDEIIISAEYFPYLQLGPDNYGFYFFVGFLGIDPTSGTSSSELYVIVIPRSALNTTVLVTTKHGEDTFDILNGFPTKIIIPSDLMGCSDGGEAEIQEKGVEIKSYDMELGVLVCSKETGTADCYTALPVDITGTNYVTTSMYVADETSEFMIIGQEDGTSVTITVPSASTHTVTLNGSTTNPGESLTVPLDKRMAFHLGQTSADADQSHVNGYLVTSDKPVAMISGTREIEGDHVVEPVPPTEIPGREYVLIHANLADTSETTYIVQPVTVGDTVVTRYLPGDTSEDHTVTYGDYLSIDVADGVPCELIADKPVMVTQVANAAFGSSMVVMPAVNQWAPEYNFYHPDYTLSALVVFKSEEHKSYYQVNNQIIAPQSTVAVNGPNGYFFGANTLTTGSWNLKLDTPTGYPTFMAIGYLSDGASADTGTGAAVLGWGYRYSAFGFCKKVGRVSDLMDNDCDGLIDEEIPDGEDNDGDGFRDEDLAGSSAESNGAVAVRIINCKVSADPTFQDSTKTQQITGSDGCAVTDSVVFAMEGQFTPQTGDNIGTGSQPKLLYSGPIEVAQYIDEPKLYFTCEIESYCLSADDTDCTEICSAGKRKRREDGKQKFGNITSDIWVFPYDTGTTQPTIKETEQEASLSACLENTYVQVSFFSLGVLAIVSVFTATCFCCLFRRRNKKDKEREKTMYYSNSGSSKLF